MQFLDLGAHLHARPHIQVRQRLVEQEHLRVAHDGATHRHALPLPAGQMAWIPVEIQRQPQDLGRARHVLRDCRLWPFASDSENAMLSRTVMCGYSA